MLLGSCWQSFLAVGRSWRKHCLHAPRSSPRENGRKRWQRLSCTLSDSDPLSGFLKSGSKVSPDPARPNKGAAVRYMLWRCGIFRCLAEQVGKICKGHYLRFAASGADCSISQSIRRLLNGSFRETRRTCSGGFAAPRMNVVVGLTAVTADHLELVD